MTERQLDVLALTETWQSGQRRCPSTTRHSCWVRCRRHSSSDRPRRRCGDHLLKPVQMLGPSSHCRLATRSRLSASVWPLPAARWSYSTFIVQAPLDHRRRSTTSCRLLWSSSSSIRAQWRSETTSTFTSMTPTTQTAEVCAAMARHEGHQSRGANNFNITHASLKMVPFRSLVGYSFLFAFHSNWGHICIISEIKRDIGRISRFYSYPIRIWHPRLGVSVGELPQHLVRKKTRMARLPDGEISLILCLAVSAQYKRVTDRQTDGQTSCNICAIHSIAR